MSSAVTDMAQAPRRGPGVIDQHAELSSGTPSQRDVKPRETPTTTLAQPSKRALASAKGGYRALPAHPLEGPFAVALSPAAGPWRQNSTREQA